MELKVLGSSSKGNCYILEGERTGLVIEAGLRLQDVQVAVDFQTSKIKGALCSHSHGDHSKYIPEFLDRRIPVFGPSDIFKQHNCMDHDLANLTTSMDLFRIGDFKIMAFPLKHDVPCYGYLIKHPDMGTMLFATDTYYLPNRFKGLNHILIEANYDLDILNENISNGSIHPVVRKRVLQSHMEIKTVERMLKSNDLSQVRNIVLLHLSDGNSNAGDFEKRIERLTGIPTCIARKELNVPLNYF